MTELALTISAAAFIVTSLGGVGLALPPGAASEPLRRTGFLIRLLAACWIVPPAVALALLTVVPLAPPDAAGLWLLALAPCAPFAPALTSLARGDKASMSAVMLASVLTTVVVMPLALPLAGGRAADPLTTAGPLAAFVLLPTMLGMAVRRRAPAAAASLRPVLDAAAGGIGVTCLALVGVRYGSDIAPWSAGVAILTQLVFLAVVAAAAYGLGAGLDARQRVALTIGACTRNLGAALAPLVAAGSDQRPIVMLALAVPATIAVGVAAALWFSAGAEPRRPLSPAG